VLELVIKLSFSCLAAAVSFLLVAAVVEHHHHRRRLLVLAAVVQPNAFDEAIDELIFFLPKLCLFYFFEMKFDFLT
jgi:hypothetical protein